MSQNYSKRMPSIIQGLTKIPAPWYHAIACWSGYLFIVLGFLNAYEEKLIGLPKQGFAPEKVKLPRSSLNK